MTSGFKLGSYSEKVPTQFVTPDEGFYVLALDDWDDPVKSAYADKETGEYPWRVNLKFKVVNAIGEEGATNADGTDVVGATCGKFVDVDLNPNAKQSIWHVLCALDPTTEPEPGGEIERYRGKKLIGEIVHAVKDKKDKTTGRVIPGQSVTYANVGSVKPLKKAKPAAKPAPKQNPLTAEDDDD